MWKALFIIIFSCFPCPPALPGSHLQVDGEAVVNIVQHFLKSCQPFFNKLDTVARNKAFSSSPLPSDVYIKVLKKKLIEWPIFPVGMDKHALNVCFVGGCSLPMSLSSCVTGWSSCCWPAPAASSSLWWTAIPSGTQGPPLHYFI